MKKQCIVVMISTFLFACGGNAENIPNEGELITTETEIVSEDKKVEKLIKEEGAVIAEEESNLIEGSKEVLTEKKELVTESIEVKKSEKELTVIEKEPIKEEKPMVIEGVRPNHQGWDVLTKKYVSSIGKVNYKGIKADISKVNTYLAHLKNNSPKKEWSKNEKLAYWINLYNASTVYLIASNYPVASITKLNGGKPWDKKFVKAGDKTYSLNEIENTIVRPRFKDPRIHAALNCAAVSCPKLLNGAYLPKKLNTQLDQQTKAWINDATKNKLSENKAQLSQIFDWYKVDFKEGVVVFINKYISTGIALEAKAKITYLEYNWGLNE